MDRAFVCLFLIACSCQSGNQAATGGAGPSKRLFILDDDIGMDRDAVFASGTYDPPGLPVTDPDGGLELLYLLRDPSVELLGVTCSYGVVAESVCEGAARKTLQMAGRPDIPVITGANSSADLGTHTPAVDFLVSTVMGHPGVVEIASSGPFTNVASALVAEPRLKDTWKTLHILSGEFQMGSDVDRYGKIMGGDLNLSLDLPATQYVFEHGGPFPVYPNELMDQAVLTSADVNLLGTVQPGGAYVASQLARWMIASATLFSIDGCYPHGMTGVAVALDPSLAQVAFTAPIEVLHSGAAVNQHHWGSVVTHRRDDLAAPSHTVYMSLPGLMTFRDRYMSRLR